MIIEMNPPRGLAIFKPIVPNPTWRDQNPYYYITDKDRVENPHGIFAKSKMPPTIILGDESAQFSAQWLRVNFHDLHWINLTPDQVVSKTRIKAKVKPYQDLRTGITAYSLLAVQLNPQEITAALERIKFDEP